MGHLKIAKYHCPQTFYVYVWTVHAFSEPNTTVGQEMDLDKNPRKLFFPLFPFLFYGKNVLSKQKREKKGEKGKEHTKKLENFGFQM